MATTLSTVFGTAANLTITLTALATDDALLAGRQSTSLSVSGIATIPTDITLGGFISTGTTPSSNGVIELWAYGSLDDKPNYPDVLTGTDGNVTMTSLNVKQSGLVLLGSIQVTASSNIAYPFSVRGVAQYFGGVLPKNLGVFVVQSTGVTLNAGTTAHEISYRPMNYQSA